MNQSDQDQIEKVVDLAAPVSRVWRALTDHEEFGQWFRVRLDGPFTLFERGPQCLPQSAEFGELGI